MNKILGSDEEEDLESLRLAALQSLKRKNAFSDNSTIHYPLNSDMSPHFRGKGSRQKWGRFGSLQRPGKSGHFNRHRNTNLIPITPIGSESDVDPEKTINLPKEGSSDNLKDEQGVAKEDACSKFTRYNKSDKSESESEEDEPTSEDNQPGKLKKSDSLEALMQELDDEIQGKASDVEKPKTKKIKKKRKSSEQGSSEVQPQNEEVNKEIEAPKEDVEEVASSDNKDVSEDTSSVKLSTEKNINRFERKNPFARKHFRSRSPNSRFIPKKRRMFPNMASPPPHMPFNPPNHFGRPIMLPYMNAPCNPLFIPTNPSQPPPLYFDRPISPLSINTESLTTATLAPLSPRSARFVLENKAIIERRKRSPRRSYSRSPSRSLSRSPRYSPSPPRRFRRSVSPRRLSRSPRRFSPRKRSLSPRRRSLSPKRDVPANSQPVRAPINRPKPKPDKVEDNKPKEKEVNKIEDETTLDPILLARKKKFETKEIKKKEGIIRLKPKEDKSADAKLETTVKPLDSTLDTATSSTIIENQISKENKILEKPSSSTTKLLPVSKKAKIKSEYSKINDESKATEDPLEFQELERLLLNDDVPIDDPTVQPKVVDIFSDEESDSDNEGRFKMKQKRVNVPPVLSFSKLINGVKQEIKSEALPDYAGAKRDRRDRRSRQTSTKSKVPESSQDHQKEKVHASAVESQYKRQKITFKNEPKHSTENRVEHKIEIKIKNPSKYEKIEKIKNKAEILGEKSKIIHPIEDDDEVDEQQLATEEAYILEKSDSGDDENVIFTEGDLRTQLSRKRAEKLYKIPAEEVSTRILKFALQGAVFKKSKKKSKKKNSNDGKLPIHLRLGINSPKDIFEDIKVKKKSKKRKSREVLEQKAPSKY